MRIFRHIFFGAAAGVLLAYPAWAGTLTRAEQTVCPSLRRCLDIVERHDATEFDYTVLTQEFRRFGPKGRAGLFKILKSEVGTDYVAAMIKALGPLSVEERSWRDAAWGGPDTAKWLPLADENSQWIKILDHPERDLREIANAHLFTDYSDGEDKSGLPIQDFTPLLTALKSRPSAHLATYLSDIDVPTHKEELAQLLLSGERNTVGAAYAALYKESPSEAFKALLSALRRIQSVDQARGIGGMLSDRQATRQDGFYAKFAAELSSDRLYPVPARAAALDGYLKMLANEEAKSASPAMTGAQKEALNYLLSEQNMDAPKYAKGLSQISEDEIPNLWKHLDQYLIPGAEIALIEFEGQPSEDEILKAAVTSRDGRVSMAARQRMEALGRPMPQNMISENKSKCQFTPFDIEDLKAQMPFFDEGYISGSWPQFMQKTNRRWLSAAHPTKSGWLAGYDVGEFGGGLVYYDNKTGASTDIRFNPDEPDMDQWTPENVVAILRDHILRLGETAQAFWIVTELDHLGASNHTVFRVMETPGGFVQQRLAHQIGSTERLSLSPQGELMMGTNDGTTLRLSAEGHVSYGCPGHRSGLVPMGH